MQKTGVILVNLGTPDSASVGDIRRYLREFLSDPRVIDMHPIGRWLLLNLIILPFRPRKSAHAYKQIWTPQGSPLLLHSEQLCRDVQQCLGDQYVVTLGMRYGKPSIGQALQQLASADVHRIVALPLFPQYSSAATGSALQALYDAAAEHNSVPLLTTIGTFYNHELFIKAFADVHSNALRDFDQDMLLFSFHGLPLHHVQRSHTASNHCDGREDCPEIGPGNRHCYRAQCFATANLLAASLGLEKQAWQVGFQSRMGRTEWIGPYTEELLPALRQRGIKRLAISSPAFVADCLETLEELGIRAREQWMTLGGEDFRMVPSLNSHTLWADCVASLVTEHV